MRLCRSAAPVVFGAALCVLLVGFLAGCRTEASVPIRVTNHTPSELRCRAWVEETGYEASLVLPGPRDYGDSAMFWLPPGKTVERTLHQSSHLKAPKISPVYLSVEGAQPDDGIRRQWLSCVTGEGPFHVRISAPDGVVVFERVDAGGRPIMPDSLEVFQVRRHEYP